MDTEDGVRRGSLCSDEATQPRGGMTCPTASDIIDTLRAAAAAAPAAQRAATAAAAAAAAAAEGAPRAPVCLYTALTDAYLEGHLVFVRSAKRHTPCMRRAKPSRLGAAATTREAEEEEGPPPMYVLDQALSAASRQRVEASYADVRWVATSLPEASYASKRLTKFALNKEKVALFRLGGACDAVLKLDSGDMLVTNDLTPLLRVAPGESVWATQALGQPTGKLNGGLMLFGRFWLHEATEKAMAARAALEAREQSLFNGFFSRHLRMLPKRYNAEHRLWDTAHAAWLLDQRDSVGPDAAPTLEEAVVLHFVGRDKPWMLIEAQPRANQPGVILAGGDGQLLQAEAAACARRAREPETKAALAATCATQRKLQALWWREFGRNRTMVVGRSAVAPGSRGQGFVISQFERVLRIERGAAGLGGRTGLRAEDVGNLSVGEWCDAPEQCVARASGELYTVDKEPGLPQARTLMSVYQKKVSTFGKLA